MSLIKRKPFKKEIHTWTRQIPGHGETRSICNTSEEFQSRKTRPHGGSGFTGRCSVHVETGYIRRGKKIIIIVITLEFSERVIQGESSCKDVANLKNALETSQAPSSAKPHKLASYEEISKGCLLRGAAYVSTPFSTRHCSMRTHYHLLEKAKLSAFKVEKTYTLLGRSYSAFDKNQN